MTTHKTLEGVLTEIEERMSMKVMLSQICVDNRRLLAALRKCVEQRDGYFPGQHHNLGYTIDDDNTELLSLLTGQCEGVK